MDCDGLAQVALAKTERITAISRKRRFSPGPGFFRFLLPFFALPIVDAPQVPEDQVGAANQEQSEPAKPKGGYESPIPNCANA